MNSPSKWQPRLSVEAAGQIANAVAVRHIFDDYHARRSTNTLRRQYGDLALFARYLVEVGAWTILLDAPTPKAEADQHALDLQTNPLTWGGITWGLVAGFVRWQIGQGYAVASINVRLSTVKKYAALAFQAGVIDASEHALIRTVTGYTHRESKQIDEKRTEAEQPTRLNRKGAKKSEAVRIPDDAAAELKNGQPDTPQGRRDALLMCLLLDHGLRCGEVALLKVSNFNLAEGTLTFHRPKVDKVQTHTLSRDTRRALATWVNFGDCPETPDAPILRASNKAGKLTHAGMIERAITKRVKVLGEALGIMGLSAHDCRHYWATRASRKGTDPFALQEAGGWNSLAMPRRYVEVARIANEGVKLD
jgi:integrase